MVHPTVQLDAEELRALCERWGIRELSLFGSAIRADFSAESDVDVLVEFLPDAGVSAFDLVTISDELSELVGREVDLVEGAGLRNPIRRRAIMESRRVVYTA